MSSSVLVPREPSTAVDIPITRSGPSRAPVFLPAQASCLTCNEEITDLMARELLGRFCSQRCLHAQGLPRVLGLGA